MEKEKVLEIKIIKINDSYSVFCPTKLNIKELEKIGHTITEFDVLDEVEKPVINFYFDKKNNFTFLLNETSLNVPFIIENVYIEELKKIVDEYNEKYGIPKRWRANYGEDYFYIDSSQAVLTKSDLRYDYDDNRYSLGNYFRTKEEAEKVLKSKNWQVFWANVRAGEIGGVE